MAYIYRIINKVNGKFYIGSTKDISKRWWDDMVGWYDGKITMEDDIIDKTLWYCKNKNSRYT